MCIYFKFKIMESGFSWACLVCHKEPKLGMRSPNTVVTEPHYPEDWLLTFQPKPTADNCQSTIPSRK